MGEDVPVARRRWWIGGAIAALAAAGAIGYAIVTGSRTGAERVKHMVDWDPTCRTVELRRSRAYVPAYARLWKEVEEHAHIFCTDLGDSLFYARFRTPEAARLAVTGSPPVSRTCLIASAGGGGTVYSEDRVGAGRAFRRRCERAKAEFPREETERYCVAGDEVMVDGFDEPRDFDDLCDELGGRVERAPRSVLER